MSVAFIVRDMHPVFKQLGHRKRVETIGTRRELGGLMSLPFD